MQWLLRIDIESISNKRKKIEKLDFKIIFLKSVNIKKVKIQPTEWKKTFRSHMPDKIQMCKFCKLTFASPNFLINPASTFSAKCSGCWPQCAELQ